MRPEKIETPHPQAEKGEVYLGDFTLAEYQQIEYETKRTGDRTDENRYPVFADRYEVARHPEADKNEVHLGDFSEERIVRMAWETLRAGKLNSAGLRPVFVSRSEYLNAINYIRLNRDCPTRRPPRRY